jgi:hypothetical protein
MIADVKSVRRTSGSKQKAKRNAGKNGLGGWVKCF